MLKIFDVIRNIFNRDKERQIHCPQCGGLTLAEYFKCHHCQKWTKSFFPHITSILLLGMGALLSTVFLWKIVPTHAAAMHSQGRSIWLSIRIFISVQHFLGKWFWVALPLVAPLFCYLSLIWKPHRRTGPYLTLSISILYILIILAIFLLTMFQMVIYW